ncbi:MAG: 1-acyl-sn-glycerol-3-phosphate acyltransferase [Ardenticatenaceae bacterium]|nr:1-acyl-sn-glycerol-3-phosphate acyltransferase [Anaerolineales bacterium]MCB8938864.1 1-acyl-sn-glycerol-3-phosphate acyltransferase [Ardenticatenaceae bacterium]MCB8974098.1 1-acyl-sn-glycerol-3-phosphate acyltransferase [Ardenticatenaceae bacterium]
MEPYFPDDIYHTPHDMPPHWLDRLFLSSRWGLHLQFVWEIVKARRLVAQNRYDQTAVAATSRAIFKMVEGCNGRFHITGLENIRHLTKPVVFVSNHMSSLEGNIMGCLLLPHLDFTYVIKESLTRYPVFGPVIGSRQPITVGRANPREDLQKVLQDGVALLQNGRSILLFPQHTRTPEFIPAEFNSLGVKLASRAGVPVVPVAVKTDFLVNGRTLRDFGPLDRSKPIHVAFGRPFHITNSKQAHQEIIQFIECHLEKWQTDASSPT